MDRIEGKTGAYVECRRDVFGAGDMVHAETYLLERSSFGQNEK